MCDRFDFGVMLGRVGVFSVIEENFCYVSWLVIMMGVMVLWCWILVIRFEICWLFIGMILCSWVMIVDMLFVLVWVSVMW